MVVHGDLGQITFDHRLGSLHAPTKYHSPCQNDPIGHTNSIYFGGAHI